MLKTSLLATLAALVGVVPAFAQAPAIDEGQLKFFEQKIRPVLVEHCYSCHSVRAQQAKKLQGQLFLDSAEGIAAGGESGAVLVKGKSAESLLIKALKHDGIEMPPSGKLSAEVVADFAKWIDMGAPDPRKGETPSKPKREINVEEGKQWWAFKPLSSAAGSSNVGASAMIDEHIVKAQQANGLKANKPTTKEKLIRRAYFDLIGLPPTADQVAAFVKDTSPNAYEKVLDELLASPRYGERWARHWLDAARFAESGGYEFDGFRPGAFHYRDWVIKALNADLPYDQFIRMQLAGDVLQPDEIEGAAATGFLVAGPYPGQITAKTVERIRYDQIDDMMMTIGGSMLGLTLGCVRCHEHKYDPIPHQDYYSLAASLARTVQGTRTLDLNPADTQARIEKHQAEHEKLVADLKTFASNELPKRFEAWRGSELGKQPDATHWQVLEATSVDAERSYLKIAFEAGLVVHDGLLTAGSTVRQRGRQAQRRNVANEERYDLEFVTHQKNVTALRLDAFTDKSLPQKGPGLNGDGSFQLAELKVTAKPLDPAAKDAPIELKLKPVFAAFEDKDQPLANAVDGKPNTAWVVKSTAKKDNAAVFELEAPLAGFASGTVLSFELKFRDLGIGRLRVALSTEPAPATWAGNFSPQHVGEIRAILAANGNKLPEASRESMTRWFAPYDAETAKAFKVVTDHTAVSPRPNLSEVYTTAGGGQDVFFLRRGEVDNKQGKAEPGVIQVLWRGEPNPTVDAKVDPRLRLANWMTDLERGAGPLLARVIANRIWHHHFGEGLVGTPNDFGVQGDRPTHPELLEGLANDLIRSGWKLKSLHKQIMLSAVYQQSHEVDAENAKKDPANKYLWHFRPHRLEAEIIRDSLLAIGGNLDLTMFGPSILDNTARRSVYLRVKRSELIPLMTMFDAPEPTQSIGERVATTVPTQALAMMNSPFVRQQSEKFYARLRTDVAEALRASGAATATQPNAVIEASIDRAYQQAFARHPSDAERSRMLAFVEAQRSSFGMDPSSVDKALTEFCHVLLCLNEFVYVD